MMCTDRCIRHYCRNLNESTREKAHENIGRTLSDIGTNLFKRLASSETLANTMMRDNEVNASEKSMPHELERSTSISNASKGDPSKGGRISRMLSDALSYISGSDVNQSQEDKANQVRKPVKSLDQVKLKVREL